MTEEQILSAAHRLGYNDAKKGIEREPGMVVTKLIDDGVIDPNTSTLGRGPIGEAYMNGVEQWDD